MSIKAIERIGGKDGAELRFAVVVTLIQFIPISQRKIAMNHPWHDKKHYINI